MNTNTPLNGSTKTRNGASSTKPSFYSAGSPAMKPAATSNWATPRWFFDKLNAEFSFTLDVCASRANHKCRAWYGFDHSNPARRNGLAADWVRDAKGGPIWMNPPYGREIGPWLDKAAATAEAGVAVVCLIPARTDTQWFHRTCVDHEIRFVKGRLSFGAGDSPAPFPSLVVVMRPPEGHEHD